MPEETDTRPWGDGFVRPSEAADWEHLLSAVTDLPWSLRFPSPSPPSPPSPSPPSDPDRGRAVVRRRWIDDIALVDWESGPFSGVRGARQIAETGDDYLIVSVMGAGSAVFRQDGHDWLLRPGDALFWESRRPARVTAREPVVARSVMVRRRLLEDAGCWMGGGEPARGPVPETQLLRSYLDSLGASLPRLSGAAVVAARNALLELGWGALQSASPPARRVAVERYLESHLGRRDLSAEQVAAANSISVRTLTRLFHDAGDTFTGVLRAKRIARVREELLTGDATVAALARRWGFVDSSHLNRRFRAVHGMSPQEYRDKGARTREASLAEPSERA
ncbi:AraC family transcriptional regulator [Streptomyces sp. NRRL F-5135]|uniref:AraC family transcriptional regulator n=1 Tax=Streptomyces sp. NRRL F-5135 TaxID=1463858 RepID=UPI00099B55CA|nr:AraC family transcriptional regulator [Streptomyces sp. NRRL F-5135]